MVAETKFSAISKIFEDSFKKLFSVNFSPLCRYIILPILSQVLGIAIAILPALIVSTLSTAGIGVTFSLAFVILGALIGLPLFCHAFWKYIVRTAALCIISKELINSGQLPDFKQAEQQIKNRSAAYIKLLLWIALICSVLLIPVIIVFILFIIPLETASITVQFVAMILFSFVFTLIGFALPFLFLPAFALNPDFSALDTIERSFDLVKNHAGETLVFLSLASIICVLLNLACSIPLFGLFVTLPVIIITALLMPLLVTYWYLKLEAEETGQIT